MYRYETHLHTFPASKCAKATVSEALAYYSRLQYTGVFITNHFLDGNINMDSSHPYRERLAFHVADYEEAKRIGTEIGLSVFFGVELSYAGTDFLVYGPGPEWYLQHPEIMDMKKSEELPFLMSHGALIIQAHPFREASYIDHIRLFPKAVHGVEIVNANRTDPENQMAKQYAEHYGLLPFAGSDNHVGKAQHRLAGIETEHKIESEFDFVTCILEQRYRVFQAFQPADTCGCAQ